MSNIRTSRKGVFAMEYKVGTAGRVVVARLHEGEDLYEAIESIAAKENIKAATVTITGGMRKAQVVVGPKQEKPSLVPNFENFEGPGEVFGVGTVYWDDEGPKLHLHAAMQRGQNSVIGCPRGGAEIFLILEVTIIEINGINAARKTDPQMGLKLLKLE